MTSDVHCPLYSGGQNPPPLIPLPQRKDESKLRVQLRSTCTRFRGDGGGEKGYQGGWIGGGTGFDRLSTNKQAPDSASLLLLLLLCEHQAGTNDNTTVRQSPPRRYNGTRGKQKTAVRWSQKLHPVGDGDDTTARQQQFDGLKSCTPLGRWGR